MNLREPLRISRPKTVYLHLTKRCNLDCIYCYFDAGKSMRSELSLGDLAKLFRDIVLLGPKKLVFTGGEPLLRSDIFDIACLFRQIDVGKQTSLCLISNGTLIDSQTAKSITHTFDEARISIDGPEVINDRLRGRGSFQKAMKAIDNLRHAGLSPGVSITVMSPNANYLPSFLSFLFTERFVTNFHLSPFRPVGRGAQHYELVYPWREAQLLIAQFWQQHFGAPQNLKEADTYQLIDCGNCGVGSYLNIHPDGNVYPCHVLSVKDFLLGDVRRSSLIDIYQNSNLLRRLGELDFTKLAQTSEHLKLVLANAICLGEVYRDAYQEIDSLIKQNTGDRQSFQVLT